MDIVSINADKTLFEIVASIVQSPLSWQGWFCLRIDLSECNPALYKDSLLLVKAIIGTHLKDIQGSAYFCDTKVVHILCKPPSETVLEQTGVQICDLIMSENGTKNTSSLYNLASEGHYYSKTISSSNESIFSLPLDSNPDLNEPPTKVLKTVQTEPIEAQDTIKTTKVLLVEDDPITRWMVRSALKETCDFATAPTAKKAFAMYTSYQPDVVFLDINLPDNNGCTVLQWIKNQDPDACVVMFSSNDSLDNITECLNNGAKGFISKPFMKEDLLQYVKH